MNQTSIIVNIVHPSLTESSYIHRCGSSYIPSLWIIVHPSMWIIVHLSLWITVHPSLYFIIHQSQWIIVHQPLWIIVHPLLAVIKPTSWRTLPCFSSSTGVKNSSPWITIWGYQTTVVLALWQMIKSLISYGIWRLPWRCWHWTVTEAINQQWRWQTLLKMLTQCQKLKLSNYCNSGNPPQKKFLTLSETETIIQMC